MAAKQHDSRCALSADPMPVNGECWCDLWLDDAMTHDPLCPNAKGCSVGGVCCPCLDEVFCQCDLIREVRDSERFSTVEGAVVIASQSGASPELVQLLSSMYERRETPLTAEARREAAAELTRLAQEMGMIP